MLRRVEQYRQVLFDIKQVSIGLIGLIGPIGLISPISPIGPISPISPVGLISPIHGAVTLAGLPSLIKTTSLMIIPRSQARNFPSRDQAKRKIRSEVKLVNCRAGPPSMGLLQMLETPCRVAM